ncbi:unnamed protein product [Chironomus riparius]|uniref:CRAL-TRIO domain-containing protein n=1 Tax=Chironomus riparius TaxID=315576 RepID=A0A9N9RWU7_9DIPT|nr:unnamed protein product [Chironomus riparius]
MSDFQENLDNLFELHRQKLDKFEEWISTQPNIPKNIPQTILLRYLKVCNFDLEESEKLLDINVKFRIKNQFLFTERDIESEDIRKILEVFQYTGFPKLTSEGYAVESFRIISPELDNFILQDIMKLVIMSHDVNSLIQPNTNGVIAIYDASGFTIRHFMKVVSNAQTTIIFSQYGQEANCINLRQIHYVNCSSIVTKAISFFKSFLSKELRDKFYFHSVGYENLHKFIGKEYLPIEFGGTEGSLKDYQEDTLNKLHKYRDFVIKDENFFILNK